MIHSEANEPLDPAHVVVHKVQQWIQKLFDIFPEVFYDECIARVPDDETPNDEQGDGPIKVADHSGYQVRGHT